MDGFEGNGGGYGNDDGTRDFFSQPEHSSAFNLYFDPPAQFPSSSSISAQRAGLSSLDLNSNGEAWPGMGGTRTSYAMARTKQMARAASPPLPCTSVPPGVPLAFGRLDPAAEEAAYPLMNAFRDSIALALMNRT